MDDNDEAESILSFFENIPFSLPRLQDASKQIRLLEIVPGLGTKNEICCTMKVHQLDDPAIRYIAISYTWGDPKPRKYIYVDGRPLQVGPNCWYALWQVKNNARPASNIQQERKLDHVYWVDSICINQEDIEEKNVQVAAMGEIYAHAVSVAACIGYESHDSPLFDERFAWTWPNLTRYQREHQEGTLFELIEHLLRRPWFNRIWTVQECVLAQDIQIFCGSICVRWRMLRLQVKLTQNSHTRPQKFRELDDFFRDIDTSQTPSRGRIAFPISSVIQQYSTRECAILHDKIYGLLSMTPKHMQKRLIVNYDMPLFDLLWNYSEAISDHQIVDGKIENKPDTPTRAFYQYSSISLLAEIFITDQVFTQQLQAFWDWRIGSNLDYLGARVRDPWTYLEGGSTVYCQKVSKTHCHRIDLNTDKMASWEKALWDDLDSRPNQGTGWREWKKDRKIVTKCTIPAWASGAHATGHPKILVVNCSDNPEFPGEMHFLLPPGAEDGDFLVPMQYPADRGYFHLVCRPVESSQMPFKASIIGLAICVREPKDSRAYMPWLRDKHTAEMFIRPYDLITIALLEDSGVHYVDLLRLEQPDMASHVVLRKATKEEVGY